MSILLPERFFSSRKLFFVQFFCLTALLSNATIHTVSNDPQRPAMYTAINLAVAAASPGDTVFVYGSEFTYGATNINKQLYLYGNGSQTLAGTFMTSFGINQSISFNTGSEGSVAEGFVWQMDNSDNLVVNTSNITIRNCQFSRMRFSSSGKALVYNNVIYNSVNSGAVARIVSVIGAPNGSEFRNNLIILNNTGAGGIQFFSALDLSLFFNNVFVTWTDTSSAVFMASGCENNIYGNNIFYNIKNVSSDCDFCAFGNNLVFGCTTCDLVTGTQSGNDNLFADPQFVQYAGTGFDIATDDFDLQATSPGNLTGSDGTDIGVFGGLYPFTPGTLYNQLLPFQPYITNMTLVNPVIPVQTGGPVQIQAGAIILEE